MLGVIAFIAFAVIGFWLLAQFNRWWFSKPENRGALDELDSAFADLGRAIRDSMRR